MYLCLQFWSSSLTTKCYHDRIEKTPFAEGALRNIMIARKKNMKKCHILQILSTLEWLWMKRDGFFTIVHRNITMYSTSLNAFVGIRNVRLNPEISYGRWSIQNAFIHSKTILKFRIIIKIIKKFILIISFHFDRTINDWKK